MRLVERCMECNSSVEHLLGKLAGIIQDDAAPPEQAMAEAFFIFWRFPPLSPPLLAIRRVRHGISHRFPRFVVFSHPAACGSIRHSIATRSAAGLAGLPSTATAPHSSMPGPRPSGSASAGRTRPQSCSWRKRLIFLKPDGTPCTTRSGERANSGAPPVLVAFGDYDAMRVRRFAREHGGALV